MTTEFEKFVAGQDKVPSSDGSEFIQKKRQKLRNRLKVKAPAVHKKPNGKTELSPEALAAFEKLKRKHPKTAKMLRPLVDKKAAKARAKAPKWMFIVGAILVLINPLFLVIIVAILFTKKAAKKNKR